MTSCCAIFAEAWKFIGSLHRNKIQRKHPDLDINEGKRPVRYMSGTFRMKEDRDLKNYLVTGFQNGGSRESI